jgi:hypothetical protein
VSVRGAVGVKKGFIIMAMTMLEKQVYETSRELKTFIKEMGEFRRDMADIVRKEKEKALEFRKTVNDILSKEKEDVLEFRSDMAERNRKEDERMEEFRNRMDKLSDDVGGIGTRFGDILEIFIIPGIRPAVNKMGHDFKRVFPNKIIKDADKFKITQVDALLTNGAEAMAVEVKAHWSSTAYVDQHIGRLAKLRRYETEAGLRGKVLYGAVAGILIDKRVEEYARKHGMYVVEIVENKNLLKVRKPGIGQIRTW